MASALIHLAVAKKVLEHFDVKDEKHYYLGSIAPDIAKMVGLTRKRGHFIEEGIKSDTPNIKMFLSKYKKYLNNSYEFGYYVHLLTDVLWFDEFLPNFVKDDCLVSRTGELLHFDEDELLSILYDDYTNLNPQVLSYYNLDLSLFYEKFPFPVSHISEIPEKFFPDIIEKMGIICSKECNSNYILQFDKITHFVTYATMYVVDEIRRTL